MPDPTGGAPRGSVTSTDITVRWKEVLERIRSGEELVVTLYGKPVVRLVPVLAEEALDGR